MICPMKNCLKYAFVIVFIIISSSWASAKSTDLAEDKCITCHNNVYNKALHNIYIHGSFLKKKCITCHVEESTSAIRGGDFTATRRKKNSINWLERHYEPAKTHFFLIPARKIDGTLFVKSEDNNGHAKIVSVTVPSLDQLEHQVNDGQKPKISDIQFLGVKRGILHSATISWNTDEPTDAQIHYGIGAFNQKTRLDRQLRTLHTVDISPVIPAKTYNYTVVSNDIHGNRSISNPLTFSTGKVGLLEPAKEDVQISLSPDENGFRHQVVAVGDQYFMTITANKSTYMNIGSHRNLRRKITKKTSSSAEKSTDKHTRLKNTSDTNIASCLSCHTTYQSKSSHPINVKPKRGMTFPDDYPRLEDGKMHCMTCHEHHASNNEARIRRPTKQELCIGCHTEYQ